MRKSKSTAIVSPDFGSSQLNSKINEIELDKRLSSPLPPLVPDPDYIGTNKYYISLFQESHSNCCELLELLNDEDMWNLVKDKKNIQLYKIRRKLKPSECFIKRTVEIDGEKDEVIECFRDLDFQMEINSKLKTLEVIDEITNDATITHQVSKGFFPVNGREFYTFSNKYDLNPRTSIISNHTVDSPDFPSLKKVTRGSISTIFMFESLPDSSTTRITNVLNVDLKGKIPAFISDIMAGTMYNSFALLKKKMEQRLTGPN